MHSVIRFDSEQHKNAENSAQNSVNILVINIEAVGRMDETLGTNRCVSM
jgi:hypothetical protein